MENLKERETLGSRIGFILLSAGCAIGLGNVWRFPFITGKYGGAAFVLVYLVFLVILGAPIMIMEFAVGRASRQNVGMAFRKLEPEGTKWHVYGPVALVGNYFLMMFYTTITGWILSYIFKTADGSFAGLKADGVASIFGAMTTNTSSMFIWMIITVALGMLIVGSGLRNGVEKITKYMMITLLFLMVILAVHSMTLKGGKSGLDFYLKPDFKKMAETGVGEVIFAAMGQAFFTLSLGIGSMEIFGSYIDKKHSLTGESLRVIGLDTFVAIVSGLIIFPACFAYGVKPNSGPGLLFISLPNVFNQMTGGKIWGTLFFVFMGFAALSTVVAVFENIVSYFMDVHQWSRKKSCLINFFLITILSVPCILGFTAWSGFHPLGAGTGVLDLEDFVVSSTLLPLGSLVFLLFCCGKKYGWGYKNFIKEVDTGSGMKFPKWIKVYLSYILPVIILVIFVQGYINIFSNL